MLVPSKRNRPILQMSKRNNKPMIDLTKKKLTLLNEEEKTRDVSDQVQQSFKKRSFGEIVSDSNQAPDPILNLKSVITPKTKSRF